MFKRTRSHLAIGAFLSVALLGACSTGTTGTSPSADPSAQPTGGTSSAAAPSSEPAAGGDFSGTTLNVVAAWSGAEQANFEKVLDKFEQQTGATVNYTSFGDNGPTYIQGQLEGGTPPNVAVVG